jgi:hypothetical protein
MNALFYTEDYTYIKTMISNENMVLAGLRILVLRFHVT